jgi:hypothetical protein
VCGAVVMANKQPTMYNPVTTDPHRGWLAPITVPNALRPTSQTLRHTVNRNSKRPSRRIFMVAVCVDLPVGIKTHAGPVARRTASIGLPCAALRRARHSRPGDRTASEVRATGRAQQLRNERLRCKAHNDLAAPSPLHQLSMPLAKKVTSTGPTPGVADHRGTVALCVVVAAWVRFGGLPI